MKSLSRCISMILILSLVLSLSACAKKATEQAETVTETAAATQAPSETETEPETVKAEDEEKETEGETQTETTPVDFSTGKPWIASCVVGAVSEDTPANVKDDFYLYVNKEDILGLEILPGYSTAGTVQTRAIENKNDILALFTDGEAAESHDAVLAKTYYDLFLDWDSRNALGVTPIKEMLAPIEKADSIAELSAFYLSAPEEEQPAVLFGYSPSIDLNDSESYIMCISPGALLLGDSAEYKELTEYGKILKDASDEMALYILSRLGYSQTEAQKMLDNCYAFEKKLAPYILTSDDMRQPDYISKINNLVTYEELEKLQGDLPIVGVCDNTGYVRKDKVLLPMPEWLEALAKEYNDSNIELIKDYLIIHGAISCVSRLDRECFDKSIEISNKMKGIQGRLSDEEYAVSAAQSALEWQVAKLYCDRYVTEEDKKTVTDLCNDIKKGYEELISEKDFLSDVTKQKAIEKLRAMTVNSLYPDDWSPYSYDKLDLKTKEEGGTLFEANRQIDKEYFRKTVEKFKKPVDKNEWNGYSPTTVNCFYNMTNNSINMLAAFCRGDIYNSDMSYEEMCGTLGYVIGHEISHSFDGTGSQFDKDGNLNDWWTEEDRAAFDKKIQAIADYADTIYCWDGTHINGSIITGEACADMGGIAVMLLLAKSHDGFDYDKFFRQSAKTWLSLETYQYFLSGLTDEHPPMFYRVNATLQQFDEFNECYDIKEGDKMYLAPEKRIAIW